MPNLAGILENIILNAENSFPFPQPFSFLKEKRKTLAKKKENGRLPEAICLSQLQSNWLFLFFKPKGVSSLTKRRKGLFPNQFPITRKFMK